VGEHLVEASRGLTMPHNHCRSWQR
jgi:hypothetical protein